MKVKLIVDAGNMSPGPTIAQQLGPLGINIGKVIQDINKATSSFTGMKIPVEIDVNPKTKTYDISVFSPQVAELIKKEIGVEKGSGSPLTYKIGNIAFERCVAIAKTKLDSLLAKDLKSAVKMVIGTCVSLGVLVDNKEAKEVEKEIEQGKYDSEIKQEITEVSPEKKKKLEDYFKAVKEKQEKEKKAMEEAKAAKEAEAAASTAATKPAEGEAPKKESSQPATEQKQAKATTKPAAKK